MEKDIGKINKGEYQGAVTEIVVGIREYNKRVGVDIREFVTSERYTGPTKKGLRIPAEHFQEFKRLINSIADEDLKEVEAEPEAGQETLEDEKPTETPDKESLPDYWNQFLQNI